MRDGVAGITMWLGIASILVGWVGAIITGHKPIDTYNLTLGCGLLLIHLTLRKPA